MEKIKNKIYLFVFCLFLFAFCSADEYTGQYSGSLDDFLSQYSFYNDSTFQNYYTTILNECSFYHMFSVQSSGIGTFKGFVFFSSIDNIGFGSRSYGYNYVNCFYYLFENSMRYAADTSARVSLKYPDFAQTVSYSSIGLTSDSDFYFLSFEGSRWSLVKFGPYLVGNSFIRYYSDSYCLTGGFSNSFVTLFGDPNWGNSDYLYYYLNGCGSALCGGDIAGGTFFHGTILPAVEDDRLDLYTLKSANGQDNLVIDLSKFRGAYTAAASKTFSDITVKLECDGVEQEFFLDSSTSEITNSWNYSNNVYSLMTPYTFFGVDSYDDVCVKQVSFGLTTSSPGGSATDSFNIACEYWLKRTSVPLEPSDIDKPDFSDPDVVSFQEISDMKSQLHEFSSRFSFLDGTWNFISDGQLPDIASWATVYTNYVWFGDGNSDTTYSGHWFQMANNIPSVSDFSREFDPSLFVQNNMMWAWYDVVILKVFTVHVPGSAIPYIDTYQLAGYLVFFSDRYYDHYQVYNQIDMLRVLQEQASNDVMFYNYMYDKLDDFESKTLTGISSLIDLNKDSNSWLQSLNSGISGLERSITSGSASIVAAIENIDIPEPVFFDDSGIILAINNGFNSLTSRLNYLLVPSFSWKNTNYSTYLDSLGVLSAPFRFGSQALIGLENRYNSNLVYDIDSVSMPLPDGGSFEILPDQHLSLSMASIGLTGDLWTNLQYFFFWLAVLGQAFLTWSVIFGKGEQELDI